MTDMLKKLEKWFDDQCDGDWEHQRGIEIQTLDNPGWSIAIDLSETKLADKPFKSVKIERSSSDWYHIRLEGERFLGFGGTQNLHEILDTFLAWVSYQGQLDHPESPATIAEAES